MPSWSAMAVGLQPSYSLSRAISAGSMVTGLPLYLPSALALRRETLGRRYGRTSRSRSRATSMPSRARSARTLSCFLRAPNVVARYDRIRSSTAHLAACGFSIEMGVSEICASSTARLRMRLEIVMDFTRSLKSVLSRSTARSILSPATRHAREARYSQWTSAGDRMWVGDLDSASRVGLTGSGLGYCQQRRWPTLRNVGTPNFTDSQ
jgi:hypothetical protein